MPPRRIVSLCPSITETLVAIGGLKRLVGATRFCTRPKGLLWGLPRVGGTKNPDVSRIRDLHPDIVFANEEENRREDVVAIEAAGIEVDISFPRRVADVPDLVRRWGAKLGETSPAEAEAIAAGIETALEELEADPPKVTFRYAYWIWKDPWMTISDDTYVADLLRRAGGTNAYGADAARYPKTTPEEARSRGVEVHLLASEPYPFRREKHAKLAQKLFGPDSLSLFVPGDDYCWHGVRTLDGLRAMRGLRKIVASPAGNAGS